MLSLDVEEYEEVIWATKEKRMEIRGIKGSYSRRSDKITGEGKQDN
jgi:hypothetical protein